MTAVDVHGSVEGHSTFSGASIDKYDEVQDALGWHGGTGAPEGLLAHAAGATENGFCVVEWWNAESDWDKFFSERLMPAFEKVGDMPQPQIPTDAQVSVVQTRRGPGWRLLEQVCSGPRLALGLAPGEWC